jgi:hypothetical protein
MRLTTSLVAIGSVASLVTAAATPGFEFPDTVPMHKRQTEGPAYECHASCGKYRPMCSLSIFSYLTNR